MQKDIVHFTVTFMCTMLEVCQSLTWDVSTCDGTWTYSSVSDNVYHWHFCWWHLSNVPCGLFSLWFQFFHIHTSFPSQTILATSTYSTPFSFVKPQSSFLQTEVSTLHLSCLLPSWPGCSVWRFTTGSYSGNVIVFISSDWACDVSLHTIQVKIGHT